MDTTPLDDELFDSVCHDLRGPLASILMGTSFVLRTLSEDGTALRTRKVIEAVRRSAEKMNRLVSEYQELTRLERGTAVLDLVENDVATLLADVAFAHREEAERAGIRMRVRAGEPAIGLCDRERLGRALSELVTNAVRATPEGGEITLSIEATASEIIVSVADTGPGIDPLVLPHVFDYRWLASQRSRQGAGLGIGVARAVVEAHGGRLALVSLPNEGTTVTLAVPIAAGAAASSPA